MINLRERVIPAITIKQPAKHNKKLKFHRNKTRIKIRTLSSPKKNRNLKELKDFLRFLEKII